MSDVDGWELIKRGNAPSGRPEFDPMPFVTRKLKKDSGAWTAGVDGKTDEEVTTVYTRLFW